MVDVVVLGAGVIGLTTALVLQERGASVEVWHRDDPADTVSAVAGAIWYPVLAEPRERVLGWSATTYRRLVALSGDPSSGVEVQPVVEVFSVAEPDVWWSAAVPHVEWLPTAAVPPPHQAAIRVVVPVCDVPRHLPWLRARVLANGGRIHRRTVTAIDEAFAAADRVVNCTGLGAASLCGDDTMQPVRGQVVLVERPPGAFALIDDTTAQPFYVIPRGSEVVLGGTAQPGDARLGIDSADTASILAGIAERVPGLRGAVLRAIKVGLRPYRPFVRLEREDVGAARRLVHNYGHGGSGYTLAWGCAEEAAALLGG